VDWINMILSLYNAAKSMKTEDLIVWIEGLNTVSNYVEFQSLIFGPTLSAKMAPPESLRDMMSGGVTFAKQCIVTPPSPDEVLVPYSPMGKHIFRLNQEYEKKAIKKVKGLEFTTIEGAPLNWAQLVGAAQDAAGITAVSDNSES
jgi:hypothetical protein